MELRHRPRHVPARLLHHEVQPARERIRRAPRWPRHANIPSSPREVSQGCLRILHDLQKCLLSITGMDAATLQPAAGAQGELTGLLMIRAYLESQGNPRKKVLIPDSAHGTNPASVVIAGYEVQNIKSNRARPDRYRPPARIRHRRCRRADGDQSQHARRVRRAHRGNRGDPARARRAALHGRREYERARRRHAPRRFRRGRDAPESAQDLFHPARRRRPRRRSGDGEENPGAVSAGSRGRPKGRRLRPRSQSPEVGRPRARLLREISACCCALWPTRWPTVPASARPPKTRC